MQRFLDNSVAVPTDRCPWAYLILVRQLLPLPNCQRAESVSGKRRTRILGRRRPAAMGNGSFLRCKRRTVEMAAMIC